MQRAVIHGLFADMACAFLHVDIHVFLRQIQNHQGYRRANSERFGNSVPVLGHPHAEPFSFLNGHPAFQLAE